MLIDSLLLIAGIALLILGGEGLVRGSVAMAQRLGISPLIVGLTTVAFGTSTPELVVSVTAALEGSTSISFGNVIGSNITNIGLMLGITAIIRPIVVNSSIIIREIPMLLLCSSAALVLGLDSWFGESDDIISRGDGAMFLLLFTVFIYYTIKDVITQKSGDRFLEDAQGSVSQNILPTWKIAGYMILGLVGLTYGGSLVVDAAIKIAVCFGIKEVVIASTVLAFGTSLPELTTCTMAALKGHSDLAIGNIIGSNIFNLLLVLGVTSAITPIAVPDKSWIDLVIMLGFTIAILPMAINHQRKITRGEGILLVCGFVGFIFWQTIR